MTRGLRLAFGLCLRDMAVDWRMSVCFVLGLTAVLAPLMVMFGLKTGLVDGLRLRLLSDPRNLEVIVVGSQQFDAAWFEQIGRRPDVAFVLPKTRAIAATMTISVPRASGLRNATVADMIPTGPGDPLLRDVTLGRAPPGMRTMIASTRLADRLKIEAGDQVTGTVQRRREGRQEAAEVTLFVGAVAPAELTSREAVYVPLELMEATETFRDGYGVPALGLSLIHI